MKVGIALKPGTSVEQVAPFIDLLDMVLVMTVEPGFGGQSFMPGMMPKVAELRRRLGPDFDIQVDGGLSPKTVGVAAAAGANCIVAGSAVFKPEPPAGETIQVLRRAVEDAAAAGRAAKEAGVCGGVGAVVAPGVLSHAG